MTDETMDGEASTAAKFKVGDVVRLKSGGYPMTVSIAAVDLITCRWHNETGQSLIDCYDPELLISAFATEIATGNQIPVESSYPEWRTKLGLT